MQTPKLSKELQEQLTTWEAFSPDALIVIQEEASEFYEGRSLLIKKADKTVQKQQVRIGIGYVIAKCRDDDHVNERLRAINVGDRIKFASGTQISAEFPDTVPEKQRVQILHLQNIIMIDRCGKV
jgi:hypothetical protein